MAQDSAAGAAVYSRFTLFIYDFWVLGVSNLYAWRCPTSSVLVPFFNKNLSKKYLDIGVGTGYFLAHTNLKSDNKITLVDLNKNSL
jgi:ubiquinone/menaquinone biosynthesis C-methylase UbiE